MYKCISNLTVLFSITFNYSWYIVFVGMIVIYITQYTFQLFSQINYHSTFKCKKKEMLPSLANVNLQCLYIKDIALDFIVMPLICSSSLLSMYRN